MAEIISTPRVIVCANSLWNLSNFRLPIIEALRADGYQVSLAAGLDGASAADAELGSVSPLGIQSDGTNLWQDAALVAQFIRLFRKQRPHVYLSFTAKPNIYGALAARVTGAKAVPNVSGLGTAFIRGGPLRGVVTALYRIAFRNCPVVFFQNPDDQHAFIEMGLVRPEQTCLLPGSGVDLQRFKPVEGPRHDGALRLLFVGRLLGDKGVRELVEAARIVRTRGGDCRFQLLGFAGAANRTAIGADEVAGWVSEGLVEYMGATDDVRPWLAQADAVVLPSYREGLPRSLLEAAAMGKPLIATDVPGSREVVQDGINGFLCQARSAQSLAASINRFIALSDEQRATMAQASRRIAVEGFSEQQVITAYREVVRRLSPLHHQE